MGIIVSLDRDLWEIPTALQNLRKKLPKPVRLEGLVVLLQLKWVAALWAATYYPHPGEGRNGYGFR